ncbi:MAG: response regulator [Mangrovicoccus sp.]|nr:response regulator [Mangrovicoccus sp.]
MQENAAKRIILVEASQGLAHAISAAVEGAGYHCDTVACATELTASVAENCPDMILIDDQDSGSSAQALCQSIRRDHDAGEIKIMLLNGSGRSIEHRRSKALGADSVLAKPFGLSELRAEMRRLLSDAPVSAV